MILKRLFKQSPSPERSCYEAIVAAARHPRFYASWGVPDTVEGRFDMILLHAFLVLDRLKGVEPQFRQALVDELFRDMDRSLREMGVGDLAVGKKVRKLAEAFYGRLSAYDKAVADNDSTLAAAIARNLFPDDPSAAAGNNVENIVTYVHEQRAELASQRAPAIAGGNVRFKEPSP